MHTMMMKLTQMLFNAYLLLILPLAGLSAQAAAFRDGNTVLSVFFYKLQAPCLNCSVDLEDCFPQSLTSLEVIYTDPNSIDETSYNVSGSQDVAVSWDWDLTETCFRMYSIGYDPILRSDNPVMTTDSRPWMGGVEIRIKLENRLTNSMANFNISALLNLNDNYTERRTYTFDEVLLDLSFKVHSDLSTCAAILSIGIIAGLMVVILFQLVICILCSVVAAKRCCVNSKPKKNKRGHSADSSVYTAGDLEDNRVSTTEDKANCNKVDSSSPSSAPHGQLETEGNDYQDMDPDAAAERIQSPPTEIQQSRRPQSSGGHEANADKEDEDITKSYPAGYTTPAQSEPTPAAASGSGKGGQMLPPLKKTGSGGILSRFQASVQKKARSFGRRSNEGPDMQSPARPSRVSKQISEDVDGYVKVPVRTKKKVHSAHLGDMDMDGIVMERNQGYGMIAQREGDDDITVQSNVGYSAVGFKQLH